MIRRWRTPLLVLAVLVVASGLLREQTARVEPAAPVDHAAQASETAAPATRADAQGLPREAVETLQAIESGGPYAYERDGATFENREGRLPSRPRGYYREYTVRTPGATDRGARRIVAGGDPPVEFYYTANHYRSFRRIEGPRQ